MPDRREAMKAMGITDLEPSHGGPSGSCETIHPASEAKELPGPTEGRIGESNRCAIRQLLCISRTVHKGGHRRIRRWLGMAEP